MKYYKRINGDYARIGRYDGNIHSPLFGTYYIDFRTVFGSKNDYEVPHGLTLFDCEKWLNDNGFVELENPIIAADGFPIQGDYSIKYFSN
ncbi:MAG: hypothetical protein J6S67_25595 [Methanobrevibacter sp.]|nr:hypothetical protein [Methanobrevibacter sp.]